MKSKQALLDIHAWGAESSSSSSSNSNERQNDPWHLYQTKLLPELQTVARKHGRGFSLADVATAFHLHPKIEGASVSTVSDNKAAAVCLPVRVNSSGSVSVRKFAAEKDERAAGRQGAELAAMLDREDVERVALAVQQGTVVRDAPTVELGWEKDFLGEEGGDEEYEGFGIRDDPMIFL